MLVRVEEILLEAPLHEHEVGEGPRGMRMEGRIVGARRAEQSVKLLLATLSYDEKSAAGLQAFYAAPYNSAEPNIFAALHSRFFY